MTKLQYAGGGIRTHVSLRNRILSPAPLTMLGYPRCSFVRNNNQLTVGIQQLLSFRSAETAQ